MERCSYIIVDDDRAKVWKACHYAADLRKASKGGHDHHPEWYLNLTAEPEVKLQVAAEMLNCCYGTQHHSARSSQMV
jgi:hypothetical protein